MSKTDTNQIPLHVAIIPDGNRRWAKANGVSTKEGHKEGYENLKRIADFAFDRGVKIVTGYGFSTENWSRSEEEVNYLIKLVTWVVNEEAEEYHNKGIRIRILGSREGLNEDLIKSFDNLESKTINNQRGTINICFNYGGRRDITDAVRKLVAEGVTPQDITEEAIDAHLSSHGLPDPDLVIRTSGEIRLSNYLIWESAYSELYFAPVLWPDFNEIELDKALDEYAQRKRNFGK